MRSKYIYRLRVNGNQEFIVESRKKGFWGWLDGWTSWKMDDPYCTGTQTLHWYAPGHPCSNVKEEATDARFAMRLLMEIKQGDIDRQINAMRQNEITTLHVED